MPTIIRKYLIVVTLVCCYVSLFTSPTLASTDPQAATSSATATVPSTAASTSDTESPTPPILVRPANNTITGDNRPEFVWRRSTDPNGNTITYTLYLNGVATYLGVSDLGNSSSSSYLARIDGNEIKLLPTLPLADGTYTWYVTARDPSGNTSQSTLWTLSIDTTSASLTLVDLDTYHIPVITEGANFDVAGPKDVYFTVLSDPFIDIQITISSSQSTTHLLKSSTNSAGLSYLYQHLEPGLYTVSIVAIDRGNNTTALPSFTVTVTQAQITVPLPPFIPTPDLVIPYTPITLPSLPATIAKIETRLPLAYTVVGLLALAILILLIFIWKRKYNIIFLHADGTAIEEAVIYHSIPTTRAKHYPVLVTKLDPISYQLAPSDRGRLYIHHLNRYSTLTIRLDEATYILSLSAKRKVYTIVLG